MADRPTIVVVDDEPEITKTVQSCLEESVDADVRGYMDPEEALDAVGAHAADLVITDFRMPGTDGLELIRLARQRRPGIGAMMITAYPDLDLAIRAVNDAAVMRFFVKPLDADELATAVKVYLRDLHRTQDREAAFERALALGRRRAKAMSAGSG